MLKREDKGYYEELVGTGKFKFKNYSKEFEAHFIMKRLFSRESLVFVELNMGEDFSKFLLEKYSEAETSLKCSLNGELDSRAKIQVDELILIGDSSGQLPNRNFKFKVFSTIIIGSKEFQENSEEDEEIRFLITNFEFNGIERTISPKGGWKFDRFRLKISGYEIIFKQLDNYHEIIKELSGSSNDFMGFTTEIIIKTKLNNYEEVKNIVEDICYLLTLAKGTDIIPAQIFHYKKGKQIWAQFLSIGKRPYRRDSLILSLPSEDIVKFLEETYPPFVKYKDSFGLPALINLYIAMKSAFYLELRCLIGYTLLETLGDNMQEFYKNNNDPIESNIALALEDFKKLLPSNHNLNDEDIQKILSKINRYKNPTLQDIIQRIKKDFKFKQNPNEEKLFSYRKYFVHKGKFPPDENNLRIYHKIIHFVDRILLSILGYTGKYCDITSGYRPKQLEYEQPSSSVEII